MALAAGVHTEQRGGAADPADPSRAGETGTDPAHDGGGGSGAGDLDVEGGHHRVLTGLTGAPPGGTPHAADSHEPARVASEALQAGLLGVELEAQVGNVDRLERTCLGRVSHTVGQRGQETEPGTARSLLLRGGTGNERGD